LRITLVRHQRPAFLFALATIARHQNQARRYGRFGLAICAKCTRTFRIVR